MVNASSQVRPKELIVEQLNTGRSGGHLSITPRKTMESAVVDQGELQQQDSLMAMASPIAKPTIVNTEGRKGEHPTVL